MLGSPTTVSVTQLPENMPTAPQSARTFGGPPSRPPLTSDSSGAQNNSDKLKRRAPSRSQKLLGDLYLLIGRLDIALQWLLVLT